MLSHISTTLFSTFSLRHPKPPPQPLVASPSPIFSRDRANVIIFLQFTKQMLLLSFSVVYFSLYFVFFISTFFCFVYAVSFSLSPLQNVCIMCTRVLRVSEKIKSATLLHIRGRNAKPTTQHKPGGCIF